MLITIPLLQSIFIEYNSKCFGGKLPEVPIELSSSIKTLGSLHIKYTASKNVRCVTYVTIRISSMYDIERDELVDTMIHEMIHLAELVDGVRGQSTPHGAYFKREMARINRTFGRHITVTHKGPIELNKPSPFNHPLSKTPLYFFISTFENGKKYITHIAKSRIFEVNGNLKRVQDLRNVKWYGTCNLNLTKWLPRTTQLKFYRISDERLSELLESATEMYFPTDNEFTVK